MIFYTGSTLNKDELSFFERFEKDQDSLDLPCWWRHGDTLRFAHTIKFDVEKTKLVTSSDRAHQRVSRLHPRSQRYEAKPRDFGFYREWKCVRIRQR